MKKKEIKASRILPLTPCLLRLGLLLAVVAGGANTQAVTRILDPSELAYQEALKARGIESQKAIARGQDLKPRSENTYRTGIVGADRRRQLTTQEQRLYSGVVAIHSESVDSEGSGFLVCDGSVMLSNAHVFFDDEGNLRGPINQISLYLSNRAGDFEQFELDPHPSARVIGRSSGFRENRHEDWILIRLKKRPNPRHYQPLRVRAEPEFLRVQNQAGAGIQVVGFLNGENWDKLSSSCPNFRSTQSNWEYSAGSSTFLYSHDCSTEGGASGSPVIQGSCQGAPQAIAVHSGGHSEARAEFDHSRPWRNNFATPISAEIIQGMRQLCGESFQAAVCPSPHQVARP